MPSQLPNVERQKARNRMFTVPRLIAVSALSLALSLSLLSAGANAQPIDLNVSSALHSVTTQPTGSSRVHDGPSPIDMGNGGWNGNDRYGNGNGDSGDGGGGWNDNGGWNSDGGYGYQGYGYSGNGHDGGKHAHRAYRSCIHNCGNLNRGASKCVRLVRVSRSHVLLGRQGYTTCKWIGVRR